MNRLLSRKEVAKEAGVTDRAVWYYTEIGLIQPAKNSVGRGTIRLYDCSAIHLCTFIKKWSDSGVGLKVIADVLSGGNLIYELLEDLRGLQQ